MVLQAIKYSKNGSLSASLDILDQLALPHRSVYLPIASCEDAWDAIKQMKVRGAPAIAIVAALSLAVEIHNRNKRTDGEGIESATSVREFVWERLKYLKTSRPTAVNLGDAVGKLKIVVEKAEKIGGSDGGTVANSYIAAAEKMLIDDVKDNEAIGMHGAIWIKEHTKAGMQRGQSNGDLKVITHCNTGSVIRLCGDVELPAYHLLADHLRRLAMARHWV
jgi:methylthioribose-1-phosphate isomerase